MKIPEPTYEQCSAHARVDLPDGRIGWALWWPQMGGYWGKCVAVVDEDDCIDVWVWHDGEFPFTGRDHDPEFGRNPIRLHISDPDHFVQFFHQLAALPSQRTT